MRVKPILFLLLFLMVLFGACPFSINAQEASCRITHLTVENGLPQSSINGVVFDKNGFLWFGTNNGLVKFDGRNLEQVFSDSLRPFVRMVESTHDGWVLANDPDANILLSHENNYFFYRTNQLSGSYKRLRGEALLGEKYNVFRNNPAMVGKDSYVEDVCWSSGKQISFHTNADTTGFYMADSIFWAIPHVEVQRFGFVNNTLIFFSKRNGHITALHNNGTFQQIKQLVLANSELNMADFAKRSFWIRGAGTLFAIYNNTFYSITLDGSTVLLKPILENLPQLATIECGAYNEATGILAIGSGVTGLYLIEKRVAKVMLAQHYAPKVFKGNKNLDVIVSLLWTKKGELLVNNGFQYGTSMKPWYGLDSMVPYFMMQDSYSRIWLEPRFGDPVVLNSDFSVYARLNKAWAYTCAVEMEKGVYWTSKNVTISKLVWHNNQFRLAFSTQLNIKGRIIHIYKLDDKHILICGTHGLYKYNLLNGRLERIKNSYEYNFRGMTISPKGNTYINSYGNGYFLLRGDSLLPLPLDKNKYLRFPHGFVFDQFGYMWIPSNFGLFQVLEQDVIDYADKQAENVYHHYYDQTYGFATNEFNGGGYPSALLAPNGNIYMASMAGLVVVNPQNTKPVLPIGPIVVTAVKVNGKIMDDFKSIALPRNFSNAAIRVQVPFFGNSKNLYVSYRIKGLDDSWIALPENGEVTISSSRGGEFTIEFRKMNGFGQNNYAYLQIPLTVEKYFYETTPFYLLSLVIIIFGAFGYSKHRNRQLVRRKAQLEAEILKQAKALNENLTSLNDKNVQLKEKAEMLNRIYMAVTHDLSSPLRFVQRTASRLERKMGELGETEIKEHLESITQTSAHSEEFVNDLLRWIKSGAVGWNTAKQWVTPNELIEKNLLLFLWLSKERGIELRHNPPYDATPINVSVELVSILIRNFIDNALKNTPAGTVTLKAFLSDEHLNICIDDTGIGMQPDIVQQLNARKTPHALSYNGHLGMKIVFDVLQVLNGDLLLQSEINKGTNVQIAIPLN